MKKIIRGTTPVIILEGEDIMEWMRGKAAEAGYAGELLSLMQMQYENEETKELDLVHFGPNNMPKIVFMVAATVEPTKDKT